MTRRAASGISSWPALTIEGGLISPAMVAAIEQRTAHEVNEESYGLRKGLSLRDEMAMAFRVGQAHFDAFSEQPASCAATKRFIAGLLREAFGFDDLGKGDGLIALMAADGRIPVIAVPPSEALDKRSDTLSTDRARSAAWALQEYLNAHEEALWGLVSNGLRIRLMRDNASLTRPAWIEADLEAIFRNDDAASFAVLWLLMHRSRFGQAGAPATDCALERWREAGAREGLVARDRLAGQVEEALKLLGSGFLQANPDMAQRLRSGRLNLTEWFNELLRLVYRLIFLMVAEDRNLLHPAGSARAARTLYARGYGLAMLRAACARRANWDRHHDRYEGMKVIFAALAHGEGRLALPALGGLFAPDQLPTLGTARLPNAAFMKALWKLSWLRADNAMMPVNWRAMETEELGSVYESLLELQPQLSDDGRELLFASGAVEKKGNQRKTTGSYYTPDSLVQALLDSALDPALDKAGAADDPERALLALKVIDPACGSGHFLLAAARRIAARLAKARAHGLPTAACYRHALRDVARNCLHGVDRNPMAVELTRVALWIETVDPGRPLGFFDAQIKCGDSLLGVFDLKVLEDGIPDAACKALTGDDKDVAKHYLAKNRKERKEKQRIDSGFAFGEQHDLTGALRRLRAMPEETLGQIERKRQALENLRAQGSDWWRLQTACDLYVAAFLLPKRKGGQHANQLTGMPERGRETVPTSGSLWRWLKGESIFGPQVGAATEAARAARAFHWPLEFADIMAAGGFDVVLGNPPWERIKLQEKEFFAARDPEIANARNKAARERGIQALARAPEGSPQRQLFEDFIAAKHLAEAISQFVRTPRKQGGRFALTGTGDVNTYALFAELFVQLSRQRAGIIVPTGIATDATTAPFFAHLVQQRRLASLFDFENRQKLFPAVDSRMKFCLLTLGRDVEQARFAFFLQEVGELADERRLFSLSPEKIAAINPNTRTAPVFRSRQDAELTAKIYARVPVLINESLGAEGNPWGVEFMAMFHMSNDSHLFRTAAKLQAEGFVRDGTDWVRPAASGGVLPLSGGANAGELALPDGGPRPAERYVPLYEAKMIHQFDHRWATYDDAGEKSDDVSSEEKQDPAFEPQPRYWVPQGEVNARLAARGWKHPWLMGWRDITNATNERTVIATIFPRVGVGNKIPLFFPKNSPHTIAALQANLSSLSFDFVARQKIGGTTLNFFIMQQFPILPPSFYTEPRLAFIVPRVLELSYTSHSLAPFTHELGHDGPPFPWDEERRARLRAGLDAFYARAYGLSRDELRYILDPADVMGEDYPSETFRVLKEKELKQYGEYRTARLVLEAWDAMEQDGTFTSLGL